MSAGSTAVRVRIEEETTMTKTLALAFVVTQRQISFRFVTSLASGKQVSK